MSGRDNVLASVYGNQRAPLRLYRLGETLTITMIKGGVITGRMTNALNEPLIALTFKQHSETAITESFGFFVR